MRFGNYAVAVTVYYCVAQARKFDKIVLIRPNNLV